jgi:hypothetical protein
MFPIGIVNLLYLPFFPEKQAGRFNPDRMNSGFICMSDMNQLPAQSVRIQL